MKFQGYIILILLLNSLSGIASCDHGRKIGPPDSTCISIDDYEIFCECCIRQTGLEEDTLNLGMGIRIRDILILNQANQLKNLEQTNTNSLHQVNTLRPSLISCQWELNRRGRIIKVYRIGLFTISPLALITGIWLGSKLGK